MGQSDNSVDDAFLDGLNIIVELVEGDSERHQVSEVPVLGMMLVVLSESLCFRLNLGQQQGRRRTKFSGFLPVQMVEVEVVHHGLPLYGVFDVFCFCSFGRCCLSSGAGASSREGGHRGGGGNEGRISTMDGGGRSAQGDNASGRCRIDLAVDKWIPTKPRADNFFRELFVTTVAKSRIHLVEEPITLSSLAGDSGEMTSQGAFAGEPAALEAVCDFFASGIGGKGFASSIFGVRDLAVPGGLVPFGIPVIPLSRGPSAVRAMRIAIFALVPLTFGGGFVKSLVGLIAFCHAEVFEAIMSKVGAGHRHGRRTRAVVAKESSSVHTSLEGYVSRPAT